jgi:hypothetical protein
MGRTNVHSAYALISDAGSDRETIAYIAYADKLVYTHATHLNQRDLDHNADLLRSGALGSWIRKEASGAVVNCEPDVPVKVPKVVASPGLQRPGREIGRRVNWQATSEHGQKEEEGPTRKELVYVLISQGQSGNVRGKVVIEPSLERAAAHAMYEVLNDYSVNFTAAVLECDIDKLQDESYGFRAVSERKLLKGASEDTKSKMIGFWCDGVLN